MFNIVISLYRVSLPRQQCPLQTSKTATATHSALKRTYRTLYSQNRKTPPTSPPILCAKCHASVIFFHTSTNATSLFDSKRRYFAIAQYASLLRYFAIAQYATLGGAIAGRRYAPLRRYFAIAQYASLLRYWLCQYAPLGGAIAGRRYAPLRRYFAIAQYASLLRYWLCQYAQPGWAISLPLNTPSWRGYVLAAGGGLRAYAAHCPRSIAPFATSPKNDETRTTGGVPK